MCKFQRTPSWWADSGQFAIIDQFYQGLGGVEAVGRAPSPQPTEHGQSMIIKILTQMVHYLPPYISLFHYHQPQLDLFSALSRVFSFCRTGKDLPLLVLTVFKFDSFLVVNFGFFLPGQMRSSLTKLCSLLSTLYHVRELKIVFNYVCRTRVCDSTGLNWLVESQLKHCWSLPAEWPDPANHCSLFQPLTNQDGLLCHMINLFCIRTLTSCTTATATAESTSCWSEPRSCAPCHWVISWS